jgi:hypothetical protein
MQSVIAQVIADQVQYGEATQGSAPAEAIACTGAELSGRFGATLPLDYGVLLENANGIDCNGLVLYGTTQSPDAPGPGGFWQGLIAANALWREGPGHESYLILGETDMDLFTVDLDGEHPVLRDKVSSDVVETFPSVAQAIESLLSSLNPMGAAGAPRLEQ